MRTISLTLVCCFGLLVSACSDEPELEKVERLPPVTLKIPGVDAPATLNQPTAPIQPVGVDTSNNIQDDSMSGVIISDSSPRPLQLDDVMRTRFAAQMQGPAGAPMLDSAFYPLGWSADGKFAYALEPPLEARDGYIINVYIQDLVTDKILWKDEYYSETRSAPRHQSFPEYWIDNKDAVNAQLSKYNISSSDNNVLFGGAIKVDEDRVSYKVEKKLRANPDFGNLAMVADYKVQLRSAKKGEKYVHKETLKQPLSLLDVDVIGYLRGQDKNRVALLVGGVRRGWEGPPHVTWFKIIGANIRKGFK